MFVCPLCGFYSYEMNGPNGKGYACARPLREENGVLVGCGWKTNNIKKALRKALGNVEL